MHSLNRSRGLWVLSISWFTGMFGLSASFPFFAVYCHKELGVSVADVGIAMGCLGVMRAVTQYLGGVVADRIHPRTIMVASQIIRSAGFVAMAASVHLRWGFYPLLGLMTLTFVAGAFHQSAAQTAVSGMLAPPDRLHGYAVTRSAANLGWAAGPAVGGLLMPFSYAVPLWLSAVLVFASALVVLPIPKYAIDEEETESGALWSALQAPGVGVYLFGVFVLGCIMSQIIAPVALYAVGIRGLPELELGYLYTLNGALVVLFQVFVTRKLRGAGYLSILAAGSFVYFGAYAVFGVMHAFWYYVVLMVIITLGEVLVAPPSLAIAERIAPKGQVGRYMGLMGFASTAGWSAGPAYGAWLLEASTPHHWLAWLVISLAGLLAAAVFMRLRRLWPAL